MGIFNNSGYHNRRSIRLRGFDYSRAGMYFITLCIHNSAQFVFGNIVGATGASPQMIGVSPRMEKTTGTSPQTGKIFSPAQMKLNEFGAIARDEWERSFQIRPEFKMDEYVIMPDHMHAIIRIGNLHTITRGDAPVVLKNQGDARVVLKNQGDARVAPTNFPVGPQPRSIGAMIAGFKSGAIKRINELRKTPGEWVWQRNYYEHIIRNEQSLFRIRQYIRNNSTKWFNDPKNHLKNEIAEFDENDNS